MPGSSVELTWKEIFSSGNQRGKTRNHPDGEGDDYIHELLPASYREAESCKVVPATRDVSKCIDSELSLERLEAMSSFFWLMGMPLPPRPLSHQLMLSREPTITHKMDMHLFWVKRNIYLKPIPRFLLKPRFWLDYLSCHDSCSCNSGTSESIGTTELGKGLEVSSCQTEPCQQRKLRKRALGFLYSYVALLSHESDFEIAQEKKLVPRDLDWSTWRCLVDALLTSKNLTDNIDPRFRYGELRLRRSNLIYFLKKRRSYMSFWTQYDDLLRANFSFVASATVYIAIVLTAMQVGLTVPRLQNNDNFVRASYGFTIFSILGPLALVILILLMFVFLFCFNWFRTWMFDKKTKRELRADAEQN